MLSFGQYLTENENPFYHAILYSGDSSKGDNHPNKTIAHGMKRFSTPEEALEHIKIYNKNISDPFAIIYHVKDGVGTEHSSHPL